MRVQAKDCTLFRHVSFDENRHTCSARTSPELSGKTLFRHNRIKQSGFTLSMQTRLNKVAAHFLGIYSIKQSGCTRVRHTQSELNSRTLSRRLRQCAQPFELNKHWQKCQRRSFSSTYQASCKILKTSCDKFLEYQKLKYE